MTELTLILGGAASGKSLFAERLITNSGLRRHYIATAQAWDDEMGKKIAAHRERRIGDWKVTEAPLDPGPAINASEPGEIILLDCATLWLSNVILAEKDIEKEIQNLFKAVRDRRAPMVIVSNETGMGIVPEHNLGRVFRDAQGNLNQRLAEAADSAILVVAGLPMVLTGALK
jgi:adenosylcobinamide kinase/adenosylcobinamide-phosphate guanylyltransferase